MVDKVTHDLNIYLDSLENHFNNDEIVLQERRLEKILRTPDIIWDSIGINSVQYPDDILALKYKQRTDAENDYDKEMALKISLAMQSKDWYLVGKLIGEPAFEYLKKLSKSD